MNNDEPLEGCLRIAGGHLSRRPDRSSGRTMKVLPKWVEEMRAPATADVVATVEV